MFVVFHVVVAVLVVSSLGKLRNPVPAAALLVVAGVPTRAAVAAVRALCVVELGAAAAALGPAVRPGATVVSILFLVFAVIVMDARRRGVVDCGCVGTSPSPPARSHALLDLAAAATAGATAVRGAPTLARLVQRDLLMAGLYVAAVGCAAALAVTFMTRHSVVSGLVRDARTARGGRREQARAVPT